MNFAKLLNELFFFFQLCIPLFREFFFILWQNNEAYDIFKCDYDVHTFHVMVLFYVYITEYNLIIWQCKIVYEFITKCLNICVKAGPHDENMIIKYII